ncbi:MAG: hypothetical protein OHM77_07695 [Candidatus Nitricoxidivorans perseverans]|uniref:Uncharacterized protein n=1 Tax=Candidatus Nitricoxidivorans perseverans TaxID=2975601 RepID=A0AA49IXM4_9PROT|nr:MAG: hypothetical protein OHM77_07695 [Candidatus Nitricoxidivorans perseverans]
MPLDPITSAIIGSIIGGAANEIASLPPGGVPSGPNMGIYRMLPQNAPRGEMSPPGAMGVEIDGRFLRLSPGVQIRDPRNMMIYPNMVRQPVPVRYLTDASGSVYRVWILSAQEAAQP